MRSFPEKLLSATLDILPTVLNDSWRFSLLFIQNKAQYFTYSNNMFYISNNGGEINLCWINKKTVSIPYEYSKEMMTGNLEGHHINPANLAMRIKQYLDSDSIDYELIIDDETSKNLLESIYSKVVTLENRISKTMTEKINDG